MEAQVRPRSGQALKNGITVANAPGTIDPGYRGPVKVILLNTAPALTAADVTDGTSLRDDLDLGSLQAVTMVMDLEDEFGITVEDEELEGLNTVSDILRLIESKQQGG